MTVQQAFLVAIRQKRIVSFVYKGEPRLVEPHVLGRLKGELGLLGYQIGGGSNSAGSLPDWRRFDVDLIDSAKMTSQTFAGARRTPGGRHSSFDETLAIVEPPDSDDEDGDA